MEVRKLQKVGSSTLSVSLPADWAAELGLRRGDSVQVVPDGAELRIIPVRGSAPADAAAAVFVVDADACGTAEVLSRVLIACYVLGRDRLVIRSATRLKAAEVEAVRRTSKKLIGVGILEETPEQVVLQCSIDTGRYPVDTLFKRLYNLSASALSDTVEALRTRDAKLALLAASREEDADSIYWLIMRLILSAEQDESVRTLIGLRSRADISGYSIIAADLERVADQTRVLGTNAAWLIEKGTKLPAPLQNALRQHAVEIGELFADAMRGLLSRELDKAIEATEISARLWKRKEALALSAVEGIPDPEAIARVQGIVQALVLIEESCRQIAIVAFSRHQSEPTRFVRAQDGRKTPSRSLRPKALK